MKNAGQQLGQHLELVIRQAQVVQSLFGDSLLGIGGHFEKKVIRRLAAMQKDLQKAVGQAAWLNQFRLQGPPAANVPDSSEIEHAVAVLLNQPLAALVEFVSCLFH
jgi:hypothetical protein